jgi:hypothetical protein
MHAWNNFAATGVSAQGSQLELLHDAWPSAAAAGVAAASIDRRALDVAAMSGNQATRQPLCNNSSYACACRACAHEMLDAWHTAAALTRRGMSDRRTAVPARQNIAGAGHGFRASALLTHSMQDTLRLLVATPTAVPR